MKKNLFVIIMTAIVACVMVTGPAKAEELMNAEKHLREDPMCKYEIGLMEKFERLLPLASNGEYTLIDQHMDAHDDGSYDWTMRAYNHSLKQVEVDGAHFDDIFEIIVIGAEFGSMLESY